MFLLFFLTCTVLTANASSVPLRQKRVVGGEDADIKDRPYAVSIEHEGFYICGGSIVSEHYVLTAAQCIDQNKHETSKNYTIRCGTSTKYYNGSVYEIVEIITHLSYRRNRYNNTNFDIALVRVNSPFVYSDLCKPIELYGKVYPEDFEPNSVALVSGWGWSSPTGSDDTETYQLQLLKVPLIGKRTCNTIYQKFGGIYEGQICAGYVSGLGKDLCYGDSGSPLTYDGKLIGVAIYIESDCGQRSYPSVFTEVAYFLPWIKNYVEID
ncbi:trypsin-1-like [Copidosoma floridanum]|uniref:trypsin-1-like n=1 Tax=Copidosoma floridanum TaxID=29053 RepID=UPI0006C9CDBF|nr:trypsin-1-like [Copidosoma floridanum]